MKTAVIIAPGPSYLRTLTMKNVSHSVKEFAKHPGTNVEDIQLSKG